MKNLTLILASFALIAVSCTKNNENKPTVTPTLIGVWTNDEPSDRNPTFTADSVFWDDYVTSEKYVLKSDTIVVVYPDGSTIDRLTFKVSADNQKLDLLDFWAPGTRTYHYWRLD